MPLGSSAALVSPGNLRALPLGLGRDLRALLLCSPLCPASGPSRCGPGGVCVHQCPGIYCLHSQFYLSISRPPLEKWSTRDNGWTCQSVSVLREEAHGQLVFVDVPILEAQLTMAPRPSPDGLQQLGGPRSPPDQEKHLAFLKITRRLCSTFVGKNSR